MRRTTAWTRHVPDDTRHPCRKTGWRIVEPRLLKNVWRTGEPTFLMIAAPVRNTNDASLALPANHGAGAPRLHHPARWHDRGLFGHGSHRRGRHRRWRRGSGGRRAVRQGRHPDRGGDRRCLGAPARIRASAARGLAGCLQVRAGATDVIGWMPCNCGCGADGHRATSTASSIAARAERSRSRSTAPSATSASRPRTSPPSCSGGPPFRSRSSATRAARSRALTG